MSCVKISTIAWRLWKFFFLRFVIAPATSSCSRTNSSRASRQQNGKKIKGFDERAWEWILSHNWPGNVRELKNAVERAVIMAQTEKITARRHHAASSSAERRGSCAHDRAGWRFSRRHEKQLVLRTLLRPVATRTGPRRSSAFRRTKCARRLPSLIRTNGENHDGTSGAATLSRRRRQPERAHEARRHKARPKSDNEEMQDVGLRNGTTTSRMS